MKYPLTEYLAPKFADDPLIFVDVGARWGLDARWAALGDSLRAYCFEPDAAECERLNAAAHPGVTYIPAALSARTGKATLYKTKFSASSGLYQTNMKFFGRLLNAQNAELVSAEEIDVLTLEEAREKYAIPNQDFLKLDVEGAEMDVLRGAHIGGTFGVYTEFRFHRQINGSPPFSELDQFLTARGFMLYDMMFSRQSRKALPYPGPRIHDTKGQRFFASTSGGQVMDGDAVYFRDPLQIALTRNQILRSACLFELYGLADCAAELLIEREKEAEVDVIECLNLLAGGSFKSYMESY